MATKKNRVVRNRKKYTETQKRRAASLYIKGEFPVDIGEKLSVNPQLISKWAKEFFPSKKRKSVTIKRKRIKKPKILSEIKKVIPEETSSGSLDSHKIYLDLFKALLQNKEEVFDLKEPKNFEVSNYLNEVLNTIVGCTNRYIRFSEPSTSNIIMKISLVIIKLILQMIQDYLENKDLSKEEYLFVCPSILKSNRVQEENIEGQASVTESQEGTR